LAKDVCCSALWHCRRTLVGCRGRCESCGDGIGAPSGPARVQRAIAVGCASAMTPGPDNRASTPLPRKLGIGPGLSVGLIGAPDSFAETLAVPPGARLSTSLRGTLDVIVFFTRRRAELERRLPGLRRALDPSGGLWIAWPKRASGVATDINEDVLREVILPTGLVDNKVCAIDETWSGLRFVVRLSERGRA
jgi:hypothetical protein